MSSGDLSGLPKIPDHTPMKSDVQAEVGEAYLLVPMLASVVADALKAKGGSGNPGSRSLQQFCHFVKFCAGRTFSPRRWNYHRTLCGRAYNWPADRANPTETVSTPLALTVTFTNDVANAWPPDAVAWNTQTALPEFTPRRFDPFLPVFLIWNVQLEPLKRDDGSDYGSENLKKISVSTPTALIICTSPVRPSRPTSRCDIRLDNAVEGNYVQLNEPDRQLHRKLIPPTSRLERHSKAPGRPTRIAGLFRRVSAVSILSKRCVVLSRRSRSWI